MLIHSFLFFFLSVSQDKRNVSETYNSLTLSRSTDLDLLLDTSFRAFVVADRLFFQNSIIHVTQNNSNKYISGATLSTSAVVISGHSIRISFNPPQNQNVKVNIWIINPHGCQDRAVFIRHGGSFRLNLSSNRMTCVFPIGETAHPIKCGTGNAQARLYGTDGSSNVCSEGTPEATETDHYFVAFAKSSQSFLFQDAGNQKVETCESDYFTSIGFITEKEREEWNPRVTVSCGRLPAHRSWLRIVVEVGLMGLGGVDAVMLIWKFGGRLIMWIWERIKGPKPDPGPMRGHGRMVVDETRPRSPGTVWNRH
jgi:hypothetical protein